MKIEVDEGIALAGLVLFAAVIMACLATVYHLLAPAVCVAEALT